MDQQKIEQTLKAHQEGLCEVSRETRWSDLLTTDQRLEMLRSELVRLQHIVTGQLEPSFRLREIAESHRHDAHTGEVLTPAVSRYGSGGIVRDRDRQRSRLEE